MSVFLVPVIFIASVNCALFFNSRNKGGNYRLFLGLSAPGEVHRCSASMLVLLAGFLNSENEGFIFNWIFVVTGTNSCCCTQYAKLFVQVTHLIFVC